MLNLILKDEIEKKIQIKKTLSQLAKLATQVIQLK